MTPDREPRSERGIEARRECQHAARADAAEGRRLARKKTDAMESHASRFRQRRHTLIRHRLSRSTENENGIASFMMKCCFQIIRRKAAVGIANDRRSSRDQHLREPL